MHEEASEEDLQELFGEYGEVKNMHMNLDRRTGYVKVGLPVSELLLRLGEGAVEGGYWRCAGWVVREGWWKDIAKHHWYCCFVANQGVHLQGYVLVEYSTQQAARAAIAAANGTKLLDQTISVDFAFVRPPPKNQNQNSNRGRGGGAGGRKAGGERERDRTRSPEGREE